jgi:uracil-DNA glycosylase
MEKSSIFKKYFSECWYDKLKHYIESKEFLDIAIKINQERNTNVIIPEKGSELFLKVFREVPYDKVVVNVTGQDPYYNPVNAFDGLAFSNSTLDKPQPSLSNILEEVENDIYDGFNLERLNNFSLYSWAKQGVFLNNSAHTVIKGKPESHLRYWRNFTIEVIKALNDKDNIVHMLWGTKARRYKEYITNPTHKIIETSHPSPLSNNTAAPVAFSGSRCFSQCNEYLESKNISKIIW